MRIEINKERIEYLLSQFQMSIDALLSLLNEGRKKLVGASDVLADSIELSLLKRIDKIFDKGINYYQDFSPIAQTAEGSVFFRKAEFNTELNLEARRVVIRFESLKHTLDGYNKLSEFRGGAKFKRYTIEDSARTVAMQLRLELYPQKIKDAKKFLVALIAKCAEYGILVFEFIETWNKKERANIDGFYLQPNVIVLKRQKNYKREIFTLAHELGHCVVDAEEIEKLEMMEVNSSTKYSDIERWCNDFAYYFIMGEDAAIISDIKLIGSDHEYYKDVISDISRKKHISRLALYTRLFLENKLRYAEYSRARDELAQEYQNRQKEAEVLPEQKKRGAVARPIISPLFLQSMQYAYFQGVISETTFCSKLNVQPSKFEKYIWQ